MTGGLRRPQAKKMRAPAGAAGEGERKERYFTIMYPFPPNYEKTSMGLYSSFGRDQAAAKAASGIYDKVYGKKQKVFVLKMAPNAKKEKTYPYLAVIKDVNKKVTVQGAVIPITHERKVYSLCRTKLHPDVIRIMNGDGRDAKGNPLPMAPMKVRDEIREIVDELKERKRQEEAKKAARAKKAAA